MIWVRSHQEAEVGLEMLFRYSVHALYCRLSFHLTLEIQNSRQCSWAVAMRKNGLR